MSCSCCKAEYEGGNQCLGCKEGNDWTDKPTGARVEVGRARKDGKIPVKIIFTGKTYPKLVSNFFEVMEIKAKYEV